MILLSSPFTGASRNLVFAYATSNLGEIVPLGHQSGAVRNRNYRLLAARTPPLAANRQQSFSGEPCLWVKKVTIPFAARSATTIREGQAPTEPCTGSRPKASRTPWGEPHPGAPGCLLGSRGRGSGCKAGAPHDAHGGESGAGRCWSQGCCHRGNWVPLTARSCKLAVMFLPLPKKIADWPVHAGFWPLCSSSRPRYPLP